MGGISSFDLVSSDYKIKYVDSLIPSNISSHNKNQSTKGKQFKVFMSEKGDIETFTCTEDDMTVGWLLSEIKRRYDQMYEDGQIKGNRRHIVCLKTVESILALDYYLTQLENSLNPIKESTLLSVYYAEIQENRGSKDKHVTKSDFQFLKVIGCGGYSNVVIARKKDSGRLYAIKVIKKDTTYMKTNKSIYLAEANIMKKLAGTPFIVNLHYTFQTENELYFAMDPCVGGTLFYFFTHCARGDVNLNAVKFYLAEIIIALEKIHSRNVMYRDLKPENILIDVDGHVKLSDFGLSKNIQKRDEASWTFCGSPEYLPPEMLIGTEHTRSVDFYTLGCLMYEMLIGFPPFHSVDTKNLYKRIVSGTIRFPKAIDSSAKDLILWLLSKDPEQRPTEFSQIKQHVFFKNIHWGRISKKEAIPPWIPDIYASHVPKKFTSISLKQVFHENTLYKQANRSSQNSKNQGSGSLYVYDHSSNREVRKSTNLEEALEDVLYLDGFNSSIEPKEEECIRLEIDSYFEKPKVEESKSMVNTKTKYSDNYEDSGIDDEDIGDEFECEERGFESINAVKVKDYSFDPHHLSKCKSVAPDIKCSKQDSSRKALHYKFYKKAFKNLQPAMSEQKPRCKTQRIDRRTPGKAAYDDLLL